MAEYYSNRQNSIKGSTTFQTGLSTSKPTVTTSVTNAMLTVTSRTGSDTANYSSFIEQGKPLPTNPLQFDRTKTLYNRGEDLVWKSVFDGPIYKGLILDSVSTGNIGNTYEGTVGGAATYPSGIDTRVGGRARNALLASAKNQKADMATTLAEGGKSLGTIVTGVTKIGTALTALRRGDLKEASEALGVATSRRRQRRFKRTARRDQERAIADSWLELQYGWKPIIFSVYDAAVLTADTVAPIYYSYAFGKAKETFDSSEPSSYPDGTGRITKVDRKRGFVEYRYKAKFTMVNESAHRAAMSGLTNPAVVAWELVPYSFVIDWFLPIGNYLSLLDATNGLNFAGGWITWRREAHHSREFQRVSPTHRRNTMQAWDNLQVGRGRLQTWPSSSFPSPRMPGTLTQLASGLALLSNLRK